MNRFVVLVTTKRSRIWRSKYKKEGFLDLAYYFRAKAKVTSAA